MHGPQHGCPKCVINYGFVGPIAGLLAATVGASHALYKPARDLALAADMATKVYEHATKLDLRTMPDEHEFTGCAEASKLMEHLNGGAKVNAGELAQMRAHILKHVSELVSNTDTKE